MKLVFATNNSNKIKEVSNLISNQIAIISLKDIGCNEDIVESKNTIIDNAILKANYIKNNYGYDCFADDTGLEVDFLNGRPGVHSKRFAGENSTDELNMKKLLECMEESKNRNARFRTVIALNINNQVITFTGVCEGEILKQRRGNNGFGYDPIFLPKGYNNSFGEMSIIEKNEIAHRSKAVKKLINYLNKFC
jgi:XTP/dITP diphosphohydrolase